MEDQVKIIFMDEKNKAKKQFGIHTFDINNKKWNFSWFDFLKSFFYQVISL